MWKDGCASRPSYVQTVELLVVDISQAAGKFLGARGMSFSEAHIYTLPPVASTAR